MQDQSPYTCCGGYRSFIKQLFLLLFLSSSVILVSAQFPYIETFKNATAKNLAISGAAKLTAASGIDAVGDGYLRLSENSNYSVGYVYGTDSFPSNFGMTASFEFFSHKPGANSTNQADGMTFFLFDASVNAFRPGGTGGSLGYAQYYSTPGMAKGYIGISIDAFGNFSSATDGTKNGGPGQRRSSVAIRGPGNGKAVTDYVYQTGVTTTDAAYNIGFNAFTQRYPDPANGNYRRIKIIMTPGSSLGASIGYRITIIMYKGGVTVTPVTLISNFDYPFPAPSFLQFGLAASTGSITNYHEVRNLTIEAANIVALVPPVLTNDIGVSACYGQQALIDVTANDVSLNAGGIINKATVDLDPSTAGIQTTYTDPGKGVYNVDAGGVVSFLAVNGFSGSSTAYYKVNDTYGIAASASGSVTFNVSNANAPLLTLTNPVAVCAPATVNITSAAYKTITSPGANYDYFNTITDANAGLNNINLAAAAIATSGTYYVKATLSGCSTIKPIIVQSAAAPTTSNAGSDQSYCSSTGGQNITLLANNPEVGTGVWSQVSGPSAVIVYPDAATTPLYALAKGNYVFRYAVSNGACASSSDDIQVSVGIAANAGSAQTVVNATSLALAANIATPATGVWTQISGPSVAIAEPNNPLSAITGLTPGNNYVMQWRIVNGACTSSSQVTITNVLNTIADAGADQTQASLADIMLHGNTPGLGNTGMWSIVSAPAGSLASILVPALPLATLGGITKTGDYTLRWTITNGSYSNYDEVSMRVTAVLPVSWAGFSGKERDRKVDLQWKTGSEFNNDHFTIERGEDGIHFSAVGNVKAANNSTGSAYNFRDDVATMTASLLYYRIVQVDKDLTYSYSPVITIHLLPQSRAMAWPNPTKDITHIQLVLNRSEKLSIRLYDSGGGLLLSRQQQVNAGTSTIHLSELRNSPSGIYYLQISGTDIRYAAKLLKQ